MATLLNIVRAVADNDYNTFTRQKDLVMNIAVNGQPDTRGRYFCEGTSILKGTVLRLQVALAWGIATA